MKQAIPLIILAVLLSHFAFGQESPRDGVPEGPQLGAVPDKIAFTKTYVYQAVTLDPNLTAEQKAAQEFLAHIQKRPVKIEIVKTGQIKKEMQFFENGPAMEVWKSGEFTFSINSLKPNQIMVFSSAMLSHPESAPPDPGEFGELTWVRKDNLRGKEMRQGVECFVYKEGDQVAWLEKKTHLPVYFQSSKMQVSYSYQATPTQKLILPEKFAEKLEAVKRSWMGRCN